MQIFPVLYAKGHISVALPVAFDPVHRVTIRDLVGVYAFTLEGHFVLFVIASAIGGIGEADKHRDGVFGEPGSAVPKGKYVQCYAPIKTETRALFFFFFFFVEKKWEITYLRKSAKSKSAFLLSSTNNATAPALPSWPGS